MAPQVLPNNDGTDEKNTSTFNFVLSQLSCTVFVLFHIINIQDE